MPKSKKKSKKPPAKKLASELEEFSPEEIDRILAEKSLHEFVKQAWHVIEPATEYCDNWHIEAICEHLQAVSAGTIKQILFNVPPGTMKSLLVNVFWPAWEWGPNKHAEKRFMFSSYSEDLSMRDSVKCRDLLCSEWFQTRWSLELSVDQNTKGKFQNTKRGWRMIGSVKGKGIGEHPDYMCCDDPHNTSEIESDQERQNVVNWIDNTFSTRGVSRKAAKVLIMQRLHVQDASGHVLSKGGWIHICLPMRYECPAKTQQPDGSWKIVPRMTKTPLGWTDPRTKEGELLWPKLYSEETLQVLETNLGQYGTAGQLQQRPTPRGGGMFKRVWFEILKECPALGKIVRYWDKAGTEGGLGARTATILMAEFKDETVLNEKLKKKWIVLDSKAWRVASAEREAIMQQTATLDKSKWGYVETWVEQEPGSGGKESAEGTVGNMAGFTCKIERVTGSKEVRADPFASQASVSRVKLLIGEWNQEYLDELEHFPVGKLKDLVDASGGAFNKLNGPTGAFSSTEGIRVGGVTTESLPQPDTLSASDLGLD